MTKNWANTLEVGEVSLSVWVEHQDGLLQVFHLHLNENMKKKSGSTRAAVTSDKYLSESGLQGGKGIGNHISLSSFVCGIPLLIIGLFALIGIIFDLGLPSNTAVIIAALLVTVIGLLLILGGYRFLRTNQSQK